MAIVCPKCGAKFDSTLFEFGHRSRCSCGADVEYPGAGLRQGHVSASARADRSWQVWRQSDDGNAFLVQDRLNEKEADDLIALFEARGHKQTYWKSRPNVL